MSVTNQYQLIWQVMFQSVRSSALWRGVKTRHHESIVSSLVCLNPRVQSDHLGKKEGLSWAVCRGRAGPGREKYENVMGRVGPRPILLKFDGPGLAALRPAHEAAHVFCRAGPDRCP